ncbi:MAG: ABC transporter substrate-binding protein [Betaproteobacteria bacterium]
MSPLLLALALQAAAATELVVGTLADPTSLDPHRTTDVVASEILANVCETLVRVRPGTLRPEGVLATAWATGDQRAWTFTLREGVLFHDGTPLDADAVVANLEHLRRTRGFAGRARRIGPHLVQVALERANAALLPTLSQPQFSIQSPRQLAGGGGLAAGTGPFRLSALRPGLVEMAAFDRYWGGSPRLGSVQFRRFPDADALARALETGAADVSSAIGPAEVARLRPRADLALDSQTGLNLVYLALNDERPPLSDPRVRRALSRAIDRRALLQQLGGHGEAARGPLPPSLFEHDVRSRELLLDRDSARRLLAAARVPEGSALTLTVSRAPRPYLTEPVAIAARIRDDLARVGLAVRLRELASWSEQVGLTSRGDYELALLGWHADTPDPNDFLTALVDSASVGVTNRSRYRSQAMDTLLKRARMDGAPGARRVLYREAIELFLRDMPFVPLLHASTFTVHRREVVGLATGPTGILRFDKAWKQR